MSQPLEDLRFDRQRKKIRKEMQELWAHIGSAVEMVLHNKTDIHSATQRDSTIQRHLWRRGIMIVKQNMLGRT